MDRIAIEERAKAVAKQRDGLRGPVVQDLMKFAEASLNVTPPFKGAEVCVLADIADDVCRQYDAKPPVVKKMASDGFYVWCRSNPEDPARPIYVLGEQSVEVQSILKRPASPPVQQVYQTPPARLYYPVTTPPPAFYYRPVFSGGGGCSGPACSSCR
jgi:hypothetical protein